MSFGFGSNKTIFRPKRLLNLNKLVKEVHLQHACGQSSQQKRQYFSSIHIWFTQTVRRVTLHRSPVIVITDNRISFLLYCNHSTIAPKQYALAARYCSHSVIVIIFTLALIDPLNRQTLYFFFLTRFEK